MDGLMGHYMVGAKTKFIAAHTTSSIFYVFFLSWKKKQPNFDFAHIPINLYTNLQCKQRNVEYRFWNTLIWNYSFLKNILHLRFIVMLIIRK